MSYKINTSKICRMDLEKIDKNYKYDMSRISDAQWKSLAISIIIRNEDSLEDEIAAIQTAFLKVKFSEGKTNNSAIANVNIKYVGKNDEIKEITKQFDVDGIIGEDNEFIDEMWSEMVYSALNFPYKNSCSDSLKSSQD